MTEGKPTAPAPRETGGYDVPPAILARSSHLMARFDDVVQRTSAFAVEVADTVRADPAAVAQLIHQLARVPTFLFPRWTLEILYLLSLQPRLRYSEIRGHVAGIGNRSLSVKLDELETHGLIERRVGDDRHVSYALTQHGRLLARLSFPMVLHLNLEHGLASRLGAVPDAVPPT